MRYNKALKVAASPLDISNRRMLRILRATIGFDSTRYQITITPSISTCAPRGKLATPTAALAG
jgi:hypothetical protein